MKKSIMLLIISYIALVGCTVVVDPHPRYIVREVSYQGERPAEVYYYGGYYYYAPCAHIHSQYHHTRVTHYNSHSMRVVTYSRPNTVVIKEAPHHHHDTVIIKEAPRQNTVVIKEQAFVHHHGHNTVIIKEEPRHNTVIIKEKAPERNQVIIKENRSSGRSSGSKSDNKVIIKK
jgi:hypothetical protein